MYWDLPGNCANIEPTQKYKWIFLKKLDYNFKSRLNSADWWCESLLPITLTRVRGRWLQVGASLVAQMVKLLPAMWGPGFDPWLGKIPWRRKWQPTPVLLPGKSHGWRSLVGYSPRGRQESDMTERFHFTSFHFRSIIESTNSNTEYQRLC